MSLARSFISDPHGMIFIHASCDQPLMNSPITKLSFVILSKAKNLLNNQWADTPVCPYKPRHRTGGVRPPNNADGDNCPS